jgi:hypothetical protein
MAPSLCCREFRQASGPSIKEIVMPDILKTRVELKDLIARCTSLLVRIGQRVEGAIDSGDAENLEQLQNENREHSSNVAKVHPQIHKKPRAKIGGTAPVVTHEDWEAPKFGTRIEAETLIARWTELLTSLTNLILDVESRMEGVYLRQLRNAYAKHNRNILLALDSMASKSRPQLGDPVCGTLMAGSQWIRLHGGVTQCDERFHVSVNFDDAEHMDGEDDENKLDTANYIGVEIRKHVTDLEWDDVCEEWSFDL